MRATAILKSSGLTTVLLLVACGGGVRSGAYSNKDGWKS